MLCPTFLQRWAHRAAGQFWCVISHHPEYRSCSISANPRLQRGVGTFLLCQLINTEDFRMKWFKRLLKAEGAEAVCGVQRLTGDLLSLQ